MRKQSSSTAIFTIKSTFYLIYPESTQFTAEIKVYFDNYTNKVINKTIAYFQVLLLWQPNNLHIFFCFIDCYVYGRPYCEYEYTTESMHYFFDSHVQLQIVQKHKSPKRLLRYLHAFIKHKLLRSQINFALHSQYKAIKI